MGYRKFYFNDVVRVAPKYGFYQKHEGHLGKVASTQIRNLKDKRGTLVRYEVACECGRNITPLASLLDLVAIAEDDGGFPQSHEHRLTHFLKSIDYDPLPHEIYSLDTLQEQVDGIVESLRYKRDRRVITRRYGLDGNPSKTLQAIANDEGVTKQRINGIAKRIIRQLLNKPLVKDDYYFRESKGKPLFLKDENNEPEFTNYTTIT
tara:strand:+ start:150 stop:767 length:618 start_codon:yes stop_codon:yes gene_type:complete